MAKNRILKFAAATGHSPKTRQLKGAISPRRNPRMKRLFLGRSAALLMAAALLTSGGVAASAQAATVSSHDHAIVTRPTTRLSPAIDFMCPDRTVCLFPNDNYTGNYPAWGGPAELATDVWNGSWYSFSDADASNPNPGSLNDNSGSIIWIYAADSGNPPVCLPPGKYVLDHAFGYFYIEYGVGSCPSSAPGPLP
jgi:hypothetical protein